MRVHLWQYYCLTFVSACFFFSVFHTVAEAHETTPPPSIGEPAFSDPSNLYSDPIHSVNAEPSAAIPTLLPSPHSTSSGPTAKPTPTAVPTPTPTKKYIAPIVSPAELETLFTKYGNEYGVDPNWLKKIAKCESHFNPNADTGRYAGMFQFAAATWISTRNSMGLDPNPDLRKNAEESIRTAAHMLSKGRQNAWPNCH